MGIVERIIKGKLIKGKNMNEPYLTIWKSFILALGVMIFGFGVQFLSWIAEWVNYVMR